MCDVDNDTTTPPTTMYAVSGDNLIRVSNEGE
jgi:hypothetical protein